MRLSTTCGGVALLLLCQGTASAQPAPTFKFVERADMPITRRAYDVFLRHCPGLAKLAPLMKGIVVTDDALALSEYARSRNWPITVVVEVQFRDNATATAWNMGVVLLNSYMFQLGTGSEPGIASFNSVGMKLCQADYPSDFMPTPELTFLKEWPSDASYQQPARPVHSHR